MQKQKQFHQGLVDFIANKRASEKPRVFLSLHNSDINAAMSTKSDQLQHFIPEGLNIWKDNKFAGTKLESRENRSERNISETKNSCFLL